MRPRHQPQGPTREPLEPRGVGSGCYRQNQSDVAGTIDLATGAPSSGAFVLEGLPVPSHRTVPFPANFDTIIGSGSRYDLVVEPLESAGITHSASAAPGVSPTYFSEWIEDAFLNPTLNRWGPLNLQTALRSNQGTMGHGSLDVAPGTVIELSILHTGTQTLENVSRPLVEMIPRTFRPAPTGFITVQVVSNLPIQAGTESLTINGIVVPALATYQTVTNPNVNQWDIPASLLPTGPARLRFQVREQAGTGVTSVFGINEVQY